ncbi:MAG: hypothetical protein H7A53_03660 [Akkermansiaceae bacterium]|nr:hypothetical protein [Akkermansiaceae bacterium]
MRPSGWNDPVGLAAVDDDGSVLVERFFHEDSEGRGGFPHEKAQEQADDGGSGGVGLGGEPAAGDGIGDAVETEGHQGENGRQ